MIYIKPGSFYKLEYPSGQKGIVLVIKESTEKTTMYGSRVYLILDRFGKIYHLNEAYFRGCEEI